ncbi:hypothetical protein AM493_19505 [Flavobacterium akiainvivens]|uniref:Uncharacterized protein n=1 Tax=Flavobacterium akiainvivens TaxID=1202724 RepID=A0A0M8MFT4_9FLAO|nr:hypothetical protein [Flavobacterium akiainvivens]KOS07994.1 hypothetical protein AM493_19505 [Flavobacterium akiainvivens]SFQ61711.1 hypothetical protein SAMN05444144_11046 [Flavobacterium akiainvivens]
MKKLLTRIVFLISVLLLGGQGTAFATAGKTAASELAVNALSLHHTNVLDNAQDIDSANYKTTLAPHQKQVEKVDPTDSEEEEESQTASKKLSVKKQTVAAAHYFEAAFSVTAPEYFSTIKKRTDNFARFSYSISNRWYILFRVIRI